MKLTATQRAVASLLAEGLLNKEIAHRLGVEEATVKAHVAQAAKRLGLRNRVQLAVWYVKQQASPEGETVTLEPGDSYLVPRNAERTCRILETFSAVECTSPPAITARSPVETGDGDPHDELDL